MFDLQDMSSGELVLELATAEQLESFFRDLYPLSDFGEMPLDDVRRLLFLNGYRTYEID